MSKVLCVIGIVSSGLIWLLIMACCVVAGRSDGIEKNHGEDDDDEQIDD